MSQVFWRIQNLMNFIRFSSALILLVSFFSWQIVSAETEVQENRYKLGAGDKLEIKIFGTDDMSGEYTINGAGFISIPLIGNIQAKNLTIETLQKALVDKLKPDYLLNPRLNIQVLNYRPFYILGEVESPASYPYVDGMTYLNAVAIAGGFTYRAKTQYVFVIRSNDPSQTEIEIPTDKIVLPGDIIRVDERLF
jgi:polysaccharide export outer membrane protein